MWPSGEGDHRPPGTPGASAVTAAVPTAEKVTRDGFAGGSRTTVSEEDTQHVRHWVFCDSIMPDHRRCSLPAGHSGPCARDMPP
ncbi:hypothetical protein ABZ671_24305 [Micromonospora sp. NPDC006766]|uniref:hypothetical protein n=1 Tax=Micromonospora sp. NPDC006766 TaxID=3154778 RepID=UPI0033BFF019